MSNKPRRASRGCVGLFLLTLGAYFVSSIFTSKSPPSIRRHHPRSRRDRRGETFVSRPFPACPTMKLAHRDASSSEYFSPRGPHLLPSPQFSRAGEGIVLLPPNDDPRDDEEQWMISAFDAQTRAGLAAIRRLGRVWISTWVLSRPVAREAHIDIAATTSPSSSGVDPA